MPFSINDFRSQLQFDGARPNYFEVQMAFPGNVLNAGTAATKTTFMAKSAELPASTMGGVTLYYFGREVKVPGNRTFSPWSITIIQDEDFVIRGAFESWMNLINSHVGNIRDPSMLNSLGYSVDCIVRQFGKRGNIIKEYDFIGAFPNTLGDVPLDWQSNDSIMEWPVTLEYQYWTSTFPFPTTDA